MTYCLGMDKWTKISLSPPWIIKSFILLDEKNANKIQTQPQNSFCLSNYPFRHLFSAIAWNFIHREQNKYYTHSRGVESHKLVMALLIATAKAKLDFEKWAKTARNSLIMNRMVRSRWKRERSTKNHINSRYIRFKVTSNFYGTFPFMGNFAPRHDSIASDTSSSPLMFFFRGNQMWWLISIEINAARK